MIAASAGNHALALGYHGRELNVPVTVCMPINAPIMKVNQCRKYGPNVHVVGADIMEVLFIDSSLLKKHARTSTEIEEVTRISCISHEFEVHRRYLIEF